MTGFLGRIALRGAGLLPAAELAPLRLRPRTLFEPPPAEPGRPFGSAFPELDEPADGIALAAGESGTTGIQEGAAALLRQAAAPGPRPGRPLSAVGAAPAAPRRLHDGPDEAGSQIAASDAAPADPGPGPATADPRDIRTAPYRLDTEDERAVRSPAPAARGSTGSGDARVRQSGEAGAAATAPAITAPSPFLDSSPIEQSEAGRAVTPEPGRAPRRFGGQTGRSGAFPPIAREPDDAAPAPLTLSIGRIEVEFVQPPVPAPPARPSAPARTQGFDSYAAIRRGRPR